MELNWCINILVK